MLDTRSPPSPSHPAHTVLLTTGQRYTMASVLATFALTLVLVSAFAIYQYRGEVESRRLQAQLHAQSYAQRIQDRLNTALTAAYVLGSVIKQARGTLPSFEYVAMDLMANFPMVSAVQLAPGGVIRMIHPQAGNEAALGHDLLRDRERNREAHMAIATRQLTMAGPFDLIQGGVGAVARMPVFLDEGSREVFWGFAIVLIRIPNLLETTNIGELERAGYQFELWRKKPNSDERYVFARRGEGPMAQPVEYSITVPNGQWVLSLAPRAGWYELREYGRLFGWSLVVAICVAVLQAVGMQYYLRAVAHARIVDR